MNIIHLFENYYAFGMPMPSRKYEDEKYRYAYNGMEKDDELLGEGAAYYTEFRQLG